MACPYRAYFGISVSIEGAQNLSVKKPSVAMLSINPPGIAYDFFTESTISEVDLNNAVYLTKYLDCQSQLKSPRWKNESWVHTLSKIMIASLA
jgi:hypothetical protein